MEDDETLITVGEGEMIVFARTGKIEGESPRVTDVSDADYVIVLATSGSGVVEWESERCVLTPGQQVSVPGDSIYSIESTSDETLVVTVFGVSKLL